MELRKSTITLNIDLNAMNLSPRLLQEKLKHCVTRKNRQMSIKIAQK